MAVTAERRAPSDEPFVALQGETGGATVFRCALCGTRFTHGRQACPRCPLHAACDLVRCPHCGFGFPRRSWLLDWLGRWGRRMMGR